MVLCRRHRTYLAAQASADHPSGSITKAHEATLAGYRLGLISCWTDVDDVLLRMRQSRHPGTKMQLEVARARRRI